MYTRRVDSRPLRWRLRTGAAVIAVLVVPLSVLPAAAQEPSDPGEQAPAGAAPESTDVLSSGGELVAMAEGQVLTVAAFAGGLALPVKVGVTAARLRGSTATATSGTLDLGLLGDLGLLAVANAPTLQQLGIDTSSVPAYAPLPRPLTADSRATPEVDNRVALDAVRLGPVAVGAGYETARAPEGGPASSRTELGDLRIDLGLGDLLLAGGVAESEASATEVSASVSFGEMSFRVAGNPFVVLRGIEWRMQQVVGEEPSGEFSLGSATVAGIRYASPGLEGLEVAASAINAVLAPGGVTLELPELTDTGVTPLRLMLKDSPAAFEYLNPLYSAMLADPVNAIEEALVAGVPEVGLAVTVANVLLAGLTGRGGARVDIGGLNASMATTPVESFSYGPSGFAAPSGPPPPASLPDGGTGPFASSAPSYTSAPSSTADEVSMPAPAPGDQQPALSRSAGPLSRTVSSVVGEDLPGALLLGLGGLSVVAAWLYDRRRLAEWAARS